MISIISEIETSSENMELNGTWNVSSSQTKANFIQQHDVDIVVTSDKSKDFLNRT